LEYEKNDDDEAKRGRKRRRMETSDFGESFLLVRGRRC
jgi:hypothetical protein|tara:strand:- start:130 stop:243 length:114 start_codon:yes stop_codon:yes gene_type:complete